MLKLAESFAALLLFFACASSYARELSDVPTNLDFALYLSRTDITLQYPDSNVENTIKQLGVYVYQPIYPRMDFALLAGYIDLSQSAQLLTAGMNLQGYYAGLGLRAAVFERGILSLTISSNYIFQHVEDEFKHQSVSMEWHETELGLGMKLAITNNLSALVGTKLGWIDGKQRAWGSVSRTESIEADTHTGNRVGLDLDVANGGHIGFQIFRGLHDGLEVYFQRIF